MCIQLKMDEFPSQNVSYYVLIKKTFFRMFYGGSCKERMFGFHQLSFLCNYTEYISASPTDFKSNPDHIWCIKLS